jgi:DnaJ-class molecular chaperone
LKDEKTNQVGDQVITVEIVMNKNLSDEEKELYKKLLDVQKVNPRGDILKK